MNNTLLQIDAVDEVYQGVGLITALEKQTSNRLGTESQVCKDASFFSFDEHSLPRISPLGFHLAYNADHKVYQGVGHISALKGQASSHSGPPNGNSLQPLATHRLLLIYSQAQM